MHLKLYSLIFHSKIQGQKMSNIHNNRARSACVNSAADNKAMERTFHLAVDVHVPLAARYLCVSECT
jgi:hypothetical protein